MTLIAWLRAILIFCAAAAISQRGLAQDAHSPSDAPKINHVFIIVLENEGFETTFGKNSPAPYLAHELQKDGVLLRQYFGIGHASLDNYLAMISGQPATQQTRADCQNFDDFKLDKSHQKWPTGYTEDGIAVGTGCVYPAKVLTVADQLEAANKTWHGYMEDMGNDPRREAAACAHPQIGQPDPTHKAEAPSPLVPHGDQYATRHDPFVYFHSIIDAKADCKANVVNLDRLEQDLKSETSTANFVFITPNLCNDGHDDLCADGRSGGLAAADLFLKKWVPIITGSPAYQHDGLLVITFDESDSSSVKTTPSGDKTYIYDGASCCGQVPGPNLEAFPQSDTYGSTTYVDNSFGGDRIGAVLLSPFFKGGGVSDLAFNHYSLLKTVEDIFELPHLGYAAQPGVFGFFECVAPSFVKTELKTARCKPE